MSVTVYETRDLQYNVVRRRRPMKKKNERKNVPMVMRSFRGMLEIEPNPLEAETVTWAESTRHATPKPTG